MSSRRPDPSGIANLRQRIADLSPERRAVLERRLMDGAAARGREPSIPRRASAAPCALSFAQQRLWLLQQIEPELVAYNVPVASRIQGALDVDALRRSLDAVVARHEVLRTTYVAAEPEPLQVVAADRGVDLRIVDLAGLPEAERSVELERRLAEEACRPFDLAADLMLRALLVRLAADDHALLLTKHHIASDGWSNGVLLKELSLLYGALSQGREPALPPLPIQYADYALWQRQWLQGAVLDQQLDYWRRKLEGLPPLLELPTGRPRPHILSYKGGRQSVVMPPRLSDALTRLGRSGRATLFMTMLAGFQTLLHRYTGQDDIAVGTAIAGRTRVEVEPLIGFFVNTLVLREDLSGDPTFGELLQRVRDTALGAYGHQDLPFERLVQELKPERSLDRTPLIQVMFTMQDGARSRLELAGLVTSPMEVDSAAAQFDLSLSVTPTAEGIRVRAKHNASLFDRTIIARMLQHYERLLEGVAAEPGRRLSALPLLTESERRQLAQWNNTQASYPDAVCVLHQLVEAQVARTPDAPAVTSDDGRVSYRELDARANRLARHLRGLGVERGTLVAICMDRSVAMVAGLLSILKAGAAYVPLDPSYPAERLAFMISDCGAPVLLTHSGLADRFGDCRARVVNVDADAETIAGQAPEVPDVSVSADSLAYVIYTSGSTGQPKGVMIEHRTIVNHMLWMRDTFPLGAGDAVLQKTPFSFDASVWEFWAPLLQGARLVMARPGGHQDPEYLVETIIAEQVTVLQLVPSLLRILLEEPRLLECRSLRRVFCGGEALTHELQDGFFARLPAELHNLYGPTEATIDATSWTCQPGREGARVPIGRPIANVTAYVLDARLQPVPVGVPGELCIGGAGLARGYLGRPDLTAERFIPDPFGGAPGARLYRTGDRARYLPDGAIEFLGRDDRQVKLRGFRIELGEIEATLGAHPEVRGCAVLGREDIPGDTRLVGYVVGGPGGRPPADVLRRFLAERLPDYMVPSRFVFLDVLPLTPNGKVDTGRLPAPEREAGAAALVEDAPRTPIEETLAAIWGQVLGVEQVGAHANFFAMGGHSLLAARVVSRARRAFRVDVPLRRLFETPTVRGLAEYIGRAQRSGVDAADLVIPPAPRQGVLPLSFAQERFWLLHQLAPAPWICNTGPAFRFTGPLDESAFRRAVDEVVRRHEALRTGFRTAADGGPVQVIVPEVTVAVTGIDLTPEPPARRAAQVERILAEESRRPFDLAEPPLFRVLLLRLDPHNHVVKFTIHHIVSDAWTAVVLFRELAAIYDALRRGASPRLDPLPIQYADFAVWQRHRFGGGGLDAQLSYWKRQLAGRLPIVELPTDRPRPARQSFRGGRCVRMLPLALSRRLAELRGRERVSLFMTLLAALQMLLARYTGEEDVIVGSPVAGRDRVELESMLGCFLNLLALRTDLSGDPTFRELLGRVREVVLGGYANQDVAFERVIEELKPVRDPSRTPIFQVLLNMHEFEDSLELPGLTRVDRIGRGPGLALFDLTVYFQDLPDGIRLALNYNADLFAEARMEHVMGQLERLLEQVVEDPDRRLSEFSLVTSAARGVLPDPVEPLDEGWRGPVHAALGRHARRAPAAVAVSDPAGAWTYGELEARSNQLAHHLRASGIGAEDVVAILAHRSAPLVCAVLGVLKAGAAFMILDPAYPELRLLHYLETVGPRGWIEIDGAVGPSPRLAAFAAGVACRCRLGPGARAVTAAGQPITGDPSEAPRVEVGPDTLACVAFTSGSTGQPKGVLGRHGPLSHFLPWQADAFGFTETDRFSMLSGLSHDPLQRDIFTPLWAGATICVPDPDRMMAPGWLAGWMGSEGITAVHLTPAMLQLITIGASGEGTLPGLRYSFTVGDVLSRRDVARLRRLAPRATHVNYYGATETQRAVGYFVVPPDEDGALKDTVPLGRGLPGSQLLVLTGAGGLAGVGEIGEIHVRSPHLARGYLDDDALTRERFRVNPHTGRAGDRLYRTGDLGRYRPDGAVEFVGRRDGLTKVRGFRIELGEVEGALARHPRVRAAVVVARDLGAGDRQLVAYVVPVEPPAPGLVELQRFLREWLPEYMIPSHVVPLDALPITPNGKVDHEALPSPGPEPSGSARAFVPPSDPFQHQIAQIWEEILDVRPIGIHDDFFALGGHSLLAVRMLHEVERLCGRTVPVTSLLASATISRMVELALAKEAPSFRSPFTVIQHGSKPPFFFLHGDFNGGGFYCVNLARLLGPDQPFYALHPHGLDGGPIPDSIGEMAVRHLASLRTVQPHGPYYLGGHCNGGLVAFEIARRLLAEGEPVAIVVVVDAAAWNMWSRLWRRVLPYIRRSRLMYYQGRLAVVWRSGPRGKIEFLQRRSRAVARWMIEPEPDELPNPRVAPVEVRESDRRGNAYRSAITRFVPRRYRGRVTVLVPETGPRRDDDLGWGAVADDVDVHVIPGEHLTVITRHVERLAQRLRACLDAARSG